MLLNVGVILEVFVAASAVALVVLRGVEAAGRRGKLAEAMRISSATEPDAIEATGSLAVEHHDGAPDTGRGAARMSARGVMWQIPGSWKSEGGSAPWRHIESVARRGVALRVVWGSSTGRTTLQYRGQGAPRLEGMARRHLTEPEWRTDARVGDERWDSFWSRRDYP